MPSGAELIKKAKEQITEVDPREVHDLLGNGHRNGTVLVDVREEHEFAAGPPARRRPRAARPSRVAHRGRRGRQVDARVILYCQSGNRSALAAKTLIDELGYEHVESMTGGITLWKDRGYEVEMPAPLTAEQRERYSRHLLVPEIGLEGQLKLLDAKVLLLGAGGLGSPTALYLAAAGVGHARHRRRRRRRPLEPPAPGDPHRRPHRRRRRSTRPSRRSTRSTPT